MDEASSNSSALQSTNRQLALDAALAMALLLALGIVFAVDRSTSLPAAGRGPAAQLQPTSSPAAHHPLRLGVTPDRPAFDDMGKLLHSLGSGYQYRPFPLDDLADPAKTADFDVIFLTCSGLPESWLGRRLGPGAREGTQTYTADTRALARVGANLRDFVGRGGTLYASDLQFSLVAEAFPEFVNTATGNRQLTTNLPVQNLIAQVIDPGLRELLGPQMSLGFDQPGWCPAAFVGPHLTIYLQGAYETARGARQTAPLLVKFPFQNGTVIFTSFHNEKQNSDSEIKLLRYLVFAAVTAQVESRVNQTLVQGGFSPAKHNLFSASSDEPSISRTYHCTQTGQLQFVLGFQDQGARLKLTVTAPDGKSVDKEGTSTLTIDVPAATGDWKYTVTALKVPSENFPFTVTVGQK